MVNTVLRISMVLFICISMIPFSGSAQQTTMGSESYIYNEYEVVIVWNFRSKVVQQNESYNLEIIIFNNNDLNLSIQLIGMHLDWFGNRSYDEDQLVYYSPYNLEGQNWTIKAHDQKAYFFEVWINENVSAGPHDYHFELFVIIPAWEDQGEDEGPIPPPPVWKSRTYSDFYVVEVDRDGDGVPDEEDAFPDDPGDQKDSDLDSIGDNKDQFPFDRFEWIDRDGDGHGDNSDIFPENAMEWSDSDEDGVGDNTDQFPNDRAASMDRDNDGYPDSWNTGMQSSDSTTGLKLDNFPDDPEKYEKDDESDQRIHFTSIVIFILVLIILAQSIYIFLKRIRS